MVLTINRGRKPLVSKIKSPQTCLINGYRRVKLEHFDTSVSQGVVMTQGVVVDHSGS